MLKALLLSLISLALAAMATAQTNLVLNGSFEDTVFCTTPTQCTLLKAEHWYNPNTATPDVWDCDLDRSCGDPMEPFGPNAPYFQFAQDGIRHAGNFFWDGPSSSNTREYLMTKLSGPMLAGVAYEVSLWQVRMRWRYAIDHIGVWFGADSLFETTPNWLNVTPQVRLRHPLETYLVEGNTWEQLVDTIIAAGGERWMVIGNFDHAGTVNGFDLMPPGPNLPYAYYFIDQVAVVSVDKGTGIAPTQLHALWQDDGWWLRWPSEVHPVQLWIFDAGGRLVFEERVTASSSAHRVSWPQGVPGLYVMVLTGTGVQMFARVAVTGQ